MTSVERRTGTREAAPAVRDAASGLVHVIILNWNAERDTAACIESFLGQRDVATKILLVDNASADGSGDRLRARFPSVSYLQTGANLGYAGGNNRGIDWAVGDGAEWILVVNNDTVAEPDCVRRLVDGAIGEPRLAAVAPLIVRFDDPTLVWFAGGRFDRVRAVGVHDGEGRPAEQVMAEQGDGWRPSTFLTGCCLLLRPAALEQVGAFPDDFFAYGEDVELCLRLRQAGWLLGWVPSARLAHRVPPRGAPPRPDQIRLRDRNRRRLVRRHYGAGWRILFALWFWPTRLMHLVQYALGGERGRAAAIVAGMRER